MRRGDTPAVRKRNFISPIDVPVLASEQYPQGLGPTVDSLASLLGGDLPGKLTFSCARDDGLRKLVDDTVQAVERHYIEEALKLTGGNRTAASKLLEISHRALLYKIKDYGIQ